MLNPLHWDGVLEGRHGVCWIASQEMQISHHLEELLECERVAFEKSTLAAPSKPSF